MAGATGLYSSLPCVLNDVVMIIVLLKTSKMPLNWRAPSIFSKFFFPILSCYLLFAFLGIFVHVSRHIESAHEVCWALVRSPFCAFLALWLTFLENWESCESVWNPTKYCERVLCLRLSNDRRCCSPPICPSLCRLTSMYFRGIGNVDPCGTYS